MQNQFVDFIFSIAVILNVVIILIDYFFYDANNKGVTSKKDR